jgi:hypothetical protein
MAKDKYHENVRRALENDGWVITDDPYFLLIGRRRGYIDLGAEKSIIAASKGLEKIAVEVKSFVGTSDLDSFEDALGQFLVYLFALEEKKDDRMLYLAIPEAFYERFFDDPFFMRLSKRYQVNLIVFNEQENLIVRWIK